MRGYRRWVGQDSFTKALQTGIARGLDAVDAWKQARAARPSAQARALQAEQERAVALQAYARRRYDRHAQRLQTQATTGTAVAGVAGTVGVIDVVAEAATSQVGVYGPSWMWISAAVVGGVLALSARRQRRHLPAPPHVDDLPAVPIAVPPDAIGAEQAQQLVSLRLQVVQVIPAISRLHAGAADELRRADAEAAPPLHALVERLVILHRIRHDMPGTPADEAATDAAVEVRSRLITGCATYEQLLAASATMLAAPDIVRSTDEVLSPAVAALTAYTHGLQRAAGEGLA
jgi:hypothetical protein